MTQLPPPQQQPTPQLEPRHRTRWHEVAMWLAVGIAAVATALILRLY